MHIQNVKQNEIETRNEPLRLLAEHANNNARPSVLLVGLPLADRISIRSFLAEQLDIEAEVAESVSIERAILLAQAIRPEIVIIDVRKGSSPRLEDFSRELGRLSSVIYYADTAEAAQLAFEAGAIDCLKTPISLGRLERAMDRALAWAARQKTYNALTAVVPDRESHSVQVVKPFDKWIHIAKGENIYISRPNEIIYFQADRKITRVVTAKYDGFIRQGINIVAEKMDPSIFWRIHRSIIVNADYVNYVKQDELGRAMIALRGRNEWLYASRTYEKKLLSAGIN